MSKGQNKRNPAGVNMKGVMVIGPAPGEKGGPPEHAQLGENGAFARLVPLHKIAIWKGKGPLPALSWIIWEDGRGHQQLVLAIAESQASGLEKGEM